MKVFVWHLRGGFYSDGVIVAAAETEEEARQKVLDDASREVIDSQQVHENDVARWNSNKPNSLWVDKKPSTLEQRLDWKLTDMTRCLDECSPEVHEEPFSFFLPRAD